MEQEIQSQQINQNNKSSLIVATSILLTALVVGMAVYFWQKFANEAAVKDLQQRVFSLEQQLSTMESEQVAIQSTPTNQQITPTSVKTFSIPEISIKVTFSNSYSLTKNNETNRRGSFVSYDFQQSENYQTPYLYELQFFSEESIRNFTKGCEDTLCFEGDYPDLTRYSGQKIAFAQGEDYQNFILQTFGTRNWFASSHRCVGDSCVIREYTTFLGNTKLDAWIMMGNSTEEKQADALFAQFKIE